MNTLRVVYMGTPDFAVPALEALAQDPRVEVVLVVSQPDRVRGRGKRVQRTPVASAADRHQLETFQPDSLRTPEAVERLQSTAADLFVVAAYGQILTQEVLDIPRLGCVNLHASLLPRWRGAAPIQWAVASGDAVTGTSLMRMERGLDTGPVFAQETLMIRETETAGELHDRLSQQSAQMLIQHLESIVDPECVPTPQNNDRSIYARTLTVDDRLINFDQPANKIAWYINGMAPWPSTHFIFDEHKMKVGRARLSEREVAPHTAPGTIVHADAQSGLHIAANDGRAVEILEIQRPGKKMIDARAMLQGYDIATGKIVR